MLNSLNVKCFAKQEQNLFPGSLFWILLYVRKYLVHMIHV